LGVDAAPDLRQDVRVSLSSTSSQGRFLPGAMIADRYRVVALLGRGGMGEVYRADDLKLGEAVALKFLPERVERDVSLRERLLGEARLARQVAHPNVCRVYDIGEVNGRLFLSMEYVDGEDLATLLRRIGRLPQDKAVQLAREMCNGLQAAHEQGIVHRDLKPSNVMIDGRGRARLTDFGLAALATGMSAEDASAGTPAYMAPEQLIGVEATTRSDLYSLGLVLYELFTGKAAFDAQGWAEQTYLKQNTTPSNPSQLTPGLDPLIERAIMRCLSPDPNDRPASATSVSLALPGGDPLAAALAAGELPTVEMVAEAGSEQRVPVAQSSAWLAAFVVLLIGLFAVAPQVYLIQQVPVGKPPAVLMDRAHDISTALGYTDTPRDEYGVLVYDGSQSEGLGKRFGAKGLLLHLRRDPAGSLRFMYRRSPSLMVPYNDRTMAPNVQDPPLTVSGMVMMTLDGKGQLFNLQACPLEHDTTNASAPTDWAKVFALAGLPFERFTAVAPQWNPVVYADQRMAWEGRVPGDSTIALRIEAASYRGKPVMFRRIYPWTPAVRQGDADSTIAQELLAGFIWALFVGLLALAVFVARRNLRAGTADAHSTLRMGIVAGAAFVARQFLGGHATTVSTFLSNKLFMGIAYGSLLFLLVAVLYLTLEPIIRRTWPETLVSWVRLFDGKFRDARVGRDVMAGLVLSLASTLVLIGAQLLWTRMSGQPIPYGLIDSPAYQTDAVMGPRFVAVAVLRALLNALQGSLSATAILAGATSLFRGRRILAVLATVLVMALQTFPFFDPTVPRIFAVVALLALSGFTLLRFGFLALVVFVAVSDLLTCIPLVAPGSSWYATATVTGVGAVVLLAAWAFRGMLEGRDVPSQLELGGGMSSGGMGAGAGASGAARAGSGASRPQSPSQTPTQPR
jgi:serine/threonine-protein kinase